MTDFAEPAEYAELRAAVREITAGYGLADYAEHGRTSTPQSELWAELGKAGDQNPRVLYFTGLAWQGKGDAAKANDAFRAAADFNQLSGVYGFVQPEAKRQLARS